VASRYKQYKAKQPVASRSKEYMPMHADHKQRKARLPGPRRQVARRQQAVEARH
jgi:hypothetical protein